MISKTSWIAVLFVATSALGAVPTQMAHQGVVAVNGNRFTGNGTFYFALVGNGGAGNNLWTNDGSELGTTNRPTAGVSISVADGVYSANLGGGTMVPIQPSVFNNANVVLRIWFDDGTNGVQQLMGDQVISAVAYAHHSALEPPIGSVIAWLGSFFNTPVLPDGWVQCNGQTLDEPASPYHGQIIPNLNGERRFLRGSSSSGQLEAHQFQNHTHGTDVPGDRFIRARENCGVQSIPPGGGSQCFFITHDTGPVSSGSAGSETRPINMSVIWILRVK